VWPVSGAASLKPEKRRKRATALTACGSNYSPGKGRVWKVGSEGEERERDEKGKRGGGWGMAKGRGRGGGRG